MKRFLVIFGAQFISYGFLCWNYRAVATGHLGSVFVSDLVCAFLSYTIISKIIEAQKEQTKKDRVALAAYVLGGACGSVVSVAITKLFWVL